MCTVSRAFARVTVGLGPKWSVFLGEYTGLKLIRRDDRFNYRHQIPKPLSRQIHLSTTRDQEEHYQATLDDVAVSRPASGEMRNYSRAAGLSERRAQQCILTNARGPRKGA